MAERVMIHAQEYADRIENAAKLIGDRGLDVLIVNSTEADYSNVRYFSGFWPLFETAGVAITPAGKSVLMVGPESEQYGKDRSFIPDVFPMKEYRKSADPQYPELVVSTYKDVFRFLGLTGEHLRVGIGGYLVTNPIQLEGLSESFPGAEIRRADDIMTELRSVKSENELACMREGYRITELAIDEVLRRIEPGMTELQAVGIAQRVIYENGAEYEGLPMYVFCESSTRHAISRSTHRKFEKNNLVQLNLSAKVDGYSPSIGIPVCIGKLTPDKRELIEFGLEAHRWTYEQLKGGVKASRVAKDYIEYFKKNKRYGNYLYGPCHGTGLIEVEPPWMETNSEYELKPGMTFQVDTFVSGPSFGLRWETGAVIDTGGMKLLSNPIGEIHELGR
ncbi:MAG: M24 family metallopeptidase [Alkalispirochaeta sp.]